MKHIHPAKYKRSSPSDSGRSLWPYAVALAALWTGCASPPPPVTERLLSHATSGTRIEDLERGWAIFTGPCAKCHSLDPPDKYSTVEWTRIVSEMAKPAHLSGEQERLLKQYLWAARAEMQAEKTAH